MGYGDNIPFKVIKIPGNVSIVLIGKINVCSNIVQLLQYVIG